MSAKQISRPSRGPLVIHPRAPKDEPHGRHSREPERRRPKLGEPDLLRLTRRDQRRKGHRQHARDESAQDGDAPGAPERNGFPMALT